MPGSSLSQGAQVAGSEGTAGLTVCPDLSHQLRLFAELRSEKYRGKFGVHWECFCPAQCLPGLFI